MLLPELPQRPSVSPTGTQLTELHLDPGVLQVAHGDHRAVARFDHHVVASQLSPTRCCPAALGEGMADGRQPTEAMVIRRHLARLVLDSGSGAGALERPTVVPW